MPKVSVGKVVPDFTVPATGNRTLALKSLRGQNVVIYFYPRDATPGCTTEGCEFTDLHAQFRKRNTVVLGVSRDSLASHEKFKAKYEFPFDLLSDGDEALCQLFDVIKEKNMYGKKVLGVERSTFLIDADGKLRREWRKVSAKGHAAEVLAAIDEP
jgi:peroxiredoxin Q/BCP